jgi:hypothetical protein
MIPVGSLCYIVSCGNYPDTMGAVVTVVDHGPCGSFHRAPNNSLTPCNAVAHVKGCGLVYASVTAWRMLRPIAPPTRVDVATETVAA